MAIGAWGIAGIIVGGVALVAIGMAVSNSGQAAIAPPVQPSPDSVGANIGDAIARAAPGIFAGIARLGASSGSPDANLQGSAQRTALEQSAYGQQWSWANDPNNPNRVSRT